MHIRYIYITHLRNTQVKVIAASVVFKGSQCREILSNLNDIIHIIKYKII